MEIHRYSHKYRTSIRPAWMIFVARLSEIRSFEGSRPMHFRKTTNHRLGRAKWCHQWQSWLILCSPRSLGMPKWRQQPCQMTRLGTENDNVRLKQFQEYEVWRRTGYVNKLVSRNKYFLFLLSQKWNPLAKMDGNKFFFCSAKNQTPVWCRGGSRHVEGWGDHMATISRKCN